MGAKSKIEWTDANWNPIRARRISVYGPSASVGWHCEHVSEGCRNCSAETMNKRLGTGLDFKPANRDKIELFLDERMLLAPPHWRKSRRISVCSMTDLFADFVPDEWIKRMLGIMAQCPKHTFQSLTKRPARMRKFMTEFNPVDLIAYDEGHGYEWPLQNLWLGTSCEDQATADARIPDLLATPAAVRFVSCEPMLGPIDLERIAYPEIKYETGIHYCDVLRGGCWSPKPFFRPSQNGEPKNFFTNHSDMKYGLISWTICGGESGHNARPMHPDWARSLRDQCKAAGVPFFFKQWGEWLPGESNHGQFDGRPMNSYRRCDTHEYQWPPHSHKCVQNFGTHADKFSGDFTTRRIGKKRAGRLLDRIEHNGMPGND